MLPLQVRMGSTQRSRPFDPISGQVSAGGPATAAAWSCCGWEACAKLGGLAARAATVIAAAATSNRAPTRRQRLRTGVPCRQMRVPFRGRSC